MPYIAYEDMPRPGDSEPVTSCPTCSEGWRPLDKDHCAECYEGKIERLRIALEELLEHWEKIPMWNAREVNASVERARRALCAVAPAERAES